MSSLAVHINSLNFSAQLSVVKNLMDKAQARVTFWGSRIVEIKDFTSSAYLDDIASKIMEAGRLRSAADDLTPAERVAGIDIVNRLRNFYEETDTQIQNSNFFTQFLNSIREFYLGLYFVVTYPWPDNPRFWIQYRHAGEFRAYSDVKFIQQFGGTLDNSTWRHRACDGFYGPPPRMLAKEELIRVIAEGGSVPTAVAEEDASSAGEWKKGDTYKTCKVEGAMERRIGDPPIGDQDNDVLVAPGRRFKELFGQAAAK